MLSKLLYILYWLNYLKPCIRGITKNVCQTNTNYQPKYAFIPRKPARFWTLRIFGLWNHWSSMKFWKKSSDWSTPMQLREADSDGYCNCFQGWLHPVASLAWRIQISFEISQRCKKKVIPGKAKINRGAVCQQSRCQRNLTSESLFFLVCSYFLLKYYSLSVT